MRRGRALLVVVIDRYGSLSDALFVSRDPHYCLFLSSGGSASSGNGMDVNTKFIILRHFRAIVSAAGSNDN
jgi:hypothetical protein